ncbi:hypothetical protein [Chromobacterium subtsugae]|uniref:hypothetical protein n=1 Tax=Chromobacterium subtsugae TaxID=251747 RepID=UPI0012D38733|nr:hypothetical protein [Chromobacterium subtsugae]
MAEVWLLIRFCNAAGMTMLWRKNVIAIGMPFCNERYLAMQGILSYSSVTDADAAVHLGSL